MFTTPPTLHIRSPSPTTTEFTVTTRPPPSLTRTITTVLSTILRLSIFSLLTLTLLSRHALLPPKYIYTPAVLASAPLHWFYPIALLTVWALLQRSYTEESLVVIRSIGVQTATTAGTWWGQARKTRFIPVERARDVWINEGFWGFTVRFYLCVAVEGEGEVVVVFPVGFPWKVGSSDGINGGQTLLPNRKICERVWRGARGCLGMGVPAVPAGKGKGK
ncbi:GPI-GlcNAc transferase complex [Geopyxis carbonaria]|nr:GPI-GlcNAc transferase complex [Geopyxis carbonaria]